MTIREKIKAAAGKLGENIEADAAAAEGRTEQSQMNEFAEERRRSIIQRARGVLKSSSDPKARAQAKAILARAEPATGAGQVDSRKKSRTQRMFERAERVATIAPPVETSVDTTPDPYAMWAFASAAPDPAAQADETPGGTPGEPAFGGLNAAISVEGVGSMAEINTDGLLMSANDDPDWEDNPDHLDTPEEVRDDLRDSGLNPMNVGTEAEATFGHFLVHGFADDEELGGRSAAQLEAEHDLTVQAMRDFGVGHHSPLDRSDIAEDPFGFDDAWGLSWGDD